MPDNLFARVSVFMIVVEAGKLLMMRRIDPDHEDGKLTLPSGKVEKGETPEQAAIREACEEIQITVPKGKLQHFFTQFNASSTVGPDFINLYFIVTSGPNSPVNGEPEKCSELVWVDLPPSGGNGLPNDTVLYVREAIEEYIHLRTGKNQKSYSERMY